MLSLLTNLEFLLRHVMPVQAHEFLRRTLMEVVPAKLLVINAASPAVRHESIRVARFVLVVGNLSS